RRDRGFDARRSILPAIAYPALPARGVNAAEAASNRVLDGESAGRRHSSGLRRGGAATQLQDARAAFRNGLRGRGGTLDRGDAHADRRRAGARQVRDLHLEHVRAREKRIGAAIPDCASAAPTGLASVCGILRITRSVPDADAGSAAASDRRYRLHESGHDAARRNDDELCGRLPRLQHHRTTGDLVAALLESRRLANRSDVRWALRRRSDADPASGPARTGTAMDRPKAARLGLNVPQDAFVPDERSIFDWIETIFARGVRRPGYSADRWTENFCLERFRQLGLEQVRLEPVTLPYWEPLESVLIVRADDRELRIPCFALPHSAATDGLDAGLVPWRDETPDAVRGAIALVDVPLMRFPADFPVLLAGAVAGEADANWRRYDPDS